MNISQALASAALLVYAGAASSTDSAVAQICLKLDERFSRAFSAAREAGYTAGDYRKMWDVCTSLAPRVYQGSDMKAVLDRASSIAACSAVACGVSSTTTNCIDFGNKVESVQMPLAEMRRWGCP